MYQMMVLMLMLTGFGVTHNYTTSSTCPPVTQHSQHVHKHRTIIVILSQYRFNATIKYCLWI